MNKIIVSSWIAPLYCDLEIYLDNADKIVLKYKQTKCLPDIVQSVEGKRYSVVKTGDEIIGFNQI
ncbi:hypothetical protein EK386_02075 [Lysinibacillus antri]|uniref:Uncharacterized protein n=2 Tax=Lysinibacillus antri TaxID=2498145 RepID=A0A432LFK8_9BACI|nr:hypothetical protein EK386_02075 [Lysinibacillus antri]